jgi:toxin YoeB
LLILLADDLFRQAPPSETLVGDLCGACSRWINSQRRFVYQVLRDERVVKVLRFWTHSG